MNCEDVIDMLASDGARDTPPRRTAEAHVSHCNDCRAALQAYRALAAERSAPVPRPPEGAFERAMQRALQAPAPGRRRLRGFWLGTAVGGAVAASLAVAVTTWWLRPQPVPVSVNPEVRLALNEVRQVNVALEAAEPLTGAEIHVVVTGAIALEGFAEREVRWVTDLDKGVNQLTLPVVALGPRGGQVVVEVQHGDKRRTFVVDVATADAGDPLAGRPNGLPQLVV
jgi:hypothetical protein